MQSHNRRTGHQSIPSQLSLLTGSVRLYRWRKTYIFPLLFFKRICDVWDEEYQEIVDETGDEQLAWFPESHRFQIPEDCHWNDVRTKASNVGAASSAMREIEKANPDTSTASSATPSGPTRTACPDDACSRT
jgi:type I restriction-modification system DNA methylase subunit